MTKKTALIATGGVLASVIGMTVISNFLLTQPKPDNVQLATNNPYTINPLPTDQSVPSGGITDIRQDSNGLVITIAPQTAPNVFAQSCKPTATPGYECFVSPDAKLVLISPAPVPETKTIPALSIASNPHSFTNQTYTFTFSQNQIVAAVQTAQ